MSFENFLKENFIEENGLYKPKDQSFNHFRHFGERKDNIVLLEYKEVLYLYDNTIDHKNPELKAYFELKNNDYNILSLDQEHFIYNKTKHFNRNKEIPIAKMTYVNRDESILEYFTQMQKNEKILFAVKGKEDCCLVLGENIESLDKEINQKMMKKDM